MSRNKLMCVALLAACPLLAGGWSLDYPNPNTYVSETNAIGTGNAEPDESCKYRILNPDESLDGEVAFSTPTGGWEEHFPGPMSPGPNHKAQLVDSFNVVRAQSYPVTVLN